MATSYIKIDTNSELKERAQVVFNNLGLDFSTAINIFLKLTVEKNSLPFESATYSLGTPSNLKDKITELPFKRGCMKDKMWISDDFCEPIDDFKEYME